MKENVFIFFLVLLYLAISYFVHLLLFRIKNILVFILPCVLYIALPVLIFLSVMFINDGLMSTRYYLEFGYAGMDLAMPVISLWAITALNISIVLLRKLLARIDNLPD